MWNACGSVYNHLNDILRVLCRVVCDQRLVLSDLSGRYAGMRCLRLADGPDEVGFCFVFSHARVLISMPVELLHLQ